VEILDVIYALLSYGLQILYVLQLFADWHDNVCLSVYLSVCLMMCIVAIWYILQQKCLNKWIGSDPRSMILQLSTPSSSSSCFFNRQMSNCSCHRHDKSV